MAEVTTIAWADHTFNPWIGCMKVSPACDGCYAEAWAARYRADVKWGKATNDGGNRVRTVDSTWAQPLKWNRVAASRREAYEARELFEEGVKPWQPPFVFCASLADVFDNAVPAVWRFDLFQLIRATPDLVWLLLTKRPQNIVKQFQRATPIATTPEALREAWPRNAALGTSTEDRDRWNKNVPALLKAQNALNPPFTFLSMEPLLEVIPEHEITAALSLRGPRGPGIGWVITGGESDQGKHSARVTPPGAFEAARNACAFNGVPYLHKQNGEWTRAGADRFVPLPTGRVPAIDMRVFPTGEQFIKAGINNTGRLLDGVLHDERPYV